ncbi:unnamed protein product [Discosporangium mesarthrocarpum]
MGNCESGGRTGLPETIPKTEAKVRGALEGVPGEAVCRGGGLLSTTPMESDSRDPVPDTAQEAVPAPGGAMPAKEPREATAESTPFTLPTPGNTPDGHVMGTARFNSQTETTFVFNHTTSLPSKIGNSCVHALSPEQPPGCPLPDVRGRKQLISMGTDSGSGSDLNRSSDFSSGEKTIRRGSGKSDGSRQEGPGAETTKAGELRGHGAASIQRDTFSDRACVCTNPSKSGVVTVVDEDGLGVRVGSSIPWAGANADGLVVKEEWPGEGMGKEGHEGVVGWPGRSLTAAARGAQRGGADDGKQGVSGREWALGQVEEGRQVKVQGLAGPVVNTGRESDTHGEEVGITGAAKTSATVQYCHPCQMCVSLQHQRHLCSSGKSPPPLPSPPGVIKEREGMGGTALPGGRDVEEEKAISRRRNRPPPTGEKRNHSPVTPLPLEGKALGGSFLQGGDKTGLMGKVRVGEGVGYGYGPVPKPEQAASGKATPPCYTQTPDIESRIQPVQGERYSGGGCDGEGGGSSGTEPWTRHPRSVVNLFMARASGKTGKGSVETVDVELATAADASAEEALMAATGAVTGQRQGSAQAGRLCSDCPLLHRAASCSDDGQPAIHSTEGVAETPYGSFARASNRQRQPWPCHHSEKAETRSCSRRRGVGIPTTAAWGAARDTRIGRETGVEGDDKGPEIDNMAHLPLECSSADLTQRSTLKSRGVVHAPGKDGEEKEWQGGSDLGLNHYRQDPRDSRETPLEASHHPCSLHSGPLGTSCRRPHNNKHTVEREWPAKKYRQQRLSSFPTGAVMKSSGPEVGVGVDEGVLQGLGHWGMRSQGRELEATRSQPPANPLLCGEVGWNPLLMNY